MSKLSNVVVLATGDGTNLQALIDISKINFLPINIVAVFSNNPDSKALVRAQINNIPTHVLVYDKHKQTRENYDQDLVDVIKPYEPQLILMLGYMRLVTPVFIKNFQHILNLHPALPGELPGSNAIEAAYQKFQKGLIRETGVMVHQVIEEMDAGEVVDFIRVPLFDGESYQDFRKRIRLSEKPLLINSIMKYLNQIELDSRDNNNSKSELLHTMENKYISGKVRDRFDLGYDLICFHHSNRLSSFDRHICEIPGKGELLNMINEWWMRKTAHIIPNHLLFSQGDYLIAKKCEVIPLEIIVRAYITGSTKTSLWTHYNRGVRNYCGVAFPDGLKKNQKLSKPVITPTTKGETDELISYEEIIRSGTCSSEDIDYIYDKAMELFTFGSNLLKDKGLILVDTKYEFGRDSLGNIILIDEIHTCDSSRFWLESTYHERMATSVEPQKIDKDSVRDYVKGICDPYTEEIPEIPASKIEEVLACYTGFYKIISGQVYNGYSGNNKINTDLETNFTVQHYFNNIHQNLVVILSGSPSDEWHIEKLRNKLNECHILVREHVSSAHKKTREVLSILENYNSFAKFGRRIIYVTVAGRSNALSGVVACNTNYPVIACPPFQDKQDFAVNINSTLQMPSKVPVMTILEPGNVALCCQRIFRLS